jgi:hypothetical protein
MDSRNEYELTDEDQAEIDAAHAAAKKPAKAARSRARKGTFVMITEAQVDRLQAIRKATTIKFFLRLLFLDFKAHGRSFTLPNASGASDRVERQRALLSLERRGLISVQRNGNQPVLVTITAPPA